jgi:toxin-antitoxin system PIN domain toxin
MRGLLDVSLLLALAWPTHQFHATARRWFEKNERLGWASCAITQLGFLRISSQPSIFGPDAKSPLEAQQLLGSYVGSRHHVFISELPSPSRFSEFSRILGPEKVTDAYLVGLARTNRCRFVTFDQRLAALAPGTGLMKSSARRTREGESGTNPLLFRGNLI